MLSEVKIPGDAELRELLEMLLAGYESVIVWADVIGLERAREITSRVLPLALRSLPTLTAKMQSSWLDVQAEIFSVIGDLCMKAELIDVEALKACSDIAATTLSGTMRAAGDADLRYRLALGIMTAKMASCLKMADSSYKPKEKQAELEMHEKLKAL